MSSDTQSSDPAIPHLTLWRWGVPLLAALALLALGLTQSNQALFLWLNRQLHRLGEDVWNYLTFFGDTPVALLFMLLFAGRRPDWIWQFILAGLLATLWTVSLKSPLAVLRPPAVLSPEAFQLVGPALQHNAFPSGHTTTVFVLAGLFCLQAIAARWKLLLLILALLVGLSRIGCGVHWPMDVLGGMLGGWLAAVAGVEWGRRWRAGERLGVQRAFALLLIAVAAWLILVYDNGQSGVRGLQVALALGVLAAALPGLRRLFRPR